MGYHEEYIRFMASYDARETLSYVLPRLEPGMRSLDVGCGPGFLSVELAKLIAPGQLHGIDIEKSQIEMAVRQARKKGCDTAVFQLADAANLPFDDDYFDLVHCNDVLAYIPDTAAVLGEIMRVLKPGGLIACREIIVDSCFAHPELGVMDRGWAVFADLLTADDGHPQMGKDLKNCLHEAGFLDIEASAAFESYSHPREIEGFHSFLKNWFLSLDIMEPAKKYGAATDSLFAIIELAIDEWKNQVGAVAAVAVGQAVAVCPR